MPYSNKLRIATDSWRLYRNLAPWYYRNFFEILGWLVLLSVLSGVPWLWRAARASNTDNVYVCVLCILPFFVLLGGDSTSGLSSAHIIGVSFGVGVAGAALASCIVGWMRRRRVPCISVVGILTHIQCYTHYHCFSRCMFVPCHCHVPSLAQYHHKPVKLKCCQLQWCIWCPLCTGTCSVNNYVPRLGKIQDGVSFYMWMYVPSIVCHKISLSSLKHKFVGGNYCHSTFIQCSGPRYSWQQFHKSQFQDCRKQHGHYQEHQTQFQMNMNWWRGRGHYH